MAYRLGLCSRTGRAVALALQVGGGTPGLAGRWTVDLTDPGTLWQLG